MVHRPILRLNTSSDRAILAERRSQKKNMEHDATDPSKSEECGENPWFLVNSSELGGVHFETVDGQLIHVQTCAVSGSAEDVRMTSLDSGTEFVFMLDSGSDVSLHLLLTVLEMWRTFGCVIVKVPPSVFMV